MYNGINHLALITNDMDQTIRFYRDLLGFPLTACIGHDEFRHYFFKVSETDSIAFFSYDQANLIEKKRHGVPTEAPRGIDHVSIGVNTKVDLFTLKDRLEAAEFDVMGPIDHGAFWSIYFFDPSNIPLEFTWDVVRITQPPIVIDPNPSKLVAEGSEPQPGHWPTPTKTTSPEDWDPSPGAGAELLSIGIKENRVTMVEEQN